MLFCQNTNRHVRLTQDKPSQTGWLWSRMPLSPGNWQIDVEFKVGVSMFDRDDLELKHRFLLP